MIATKKGRRIKIFINTMRLGVLKNRLSSQYLLASLLMSAWLLLTPLKSSAKSFPAQEFVPISDIDEVGHFDNEPGLADNGFVVFRQGSIPGSTTKIRVGNGSPLTDITRDEAPFDHNVIRPSISDDGNHISFVHDPYGSPAVWVASKSGVPETYLYTKVADSDDVFGDNIECFGGCDVNNAGTVVFTSFYSATLQKTFFIGDGGKPTQVRNTITSSYYEDPAINNSGNIAFRLGDISEQTANKGGHAIYLLPEAWTTIVDSQYVDIGPLSFTDSNRVAFSAQNEGTNIRGVYLVLQRLFWFPTSPPQFCATAFFV